MFGLHRDRAEDDRAEDEGPGLQELLEPYGRFERLPARWPVEGPPAA